MNYPSKIWSQIRGVSKGRIIKALKKDGFLLDKQVRTERIYRHKSGRKVSIHYHAENETFGPSLLKALLEDIGWTASDLKRLKLVK